MYYLYIITQVFFVTNISSPLSTGRRLTPSSSQKHRLQKQVSQPFRILIISIIIHFHSMPFLMAMLLLLLTAPSSSLSFASLLTAPTSPFSHISEAYLSPSESLLLLSKKDNSSSALILQLRLSNGSLLLDDTYETTQDYSNYWQIFNLENEIMSFAIVTPERSDFYNGQAQPTLTASYNEVLFRGVWASTKNVGYFSTIKGAIARASKEQLANNQLTFLNNSHHFGSTFLSLSPDQKFLCSTDIFTGLVSIWTTNNSKLQAQLWLNESGIRAHTWSDDSSSLFIFGYQSGNIYIFTPQNGFSTHQVYATPASMATYCFYYYETNQVAALSANTSELVVISLANFNTTSFPTGIIDAIKLKVDATRRYFVIFNYTDLAYYKIQSFCNGSQFYDVNEGMCINCSVGCLTCGQIYCFACQANYYLNESQLCVMLPPSNSQPQPVSDFALSISKATFVAINKTITVPGHRQFLSLFFQLFSNFDHFLLYIYHKRDYGPNMQLILQEIHDTIDYRFQIISNSVCKEDLGLDFNHFQELIDYKSNYSIPSFTAYQQNGEGFFETNVQYFLLNIPLILLALLAYRYVFRLLSNYRISIFLRKFTFWGIIVLLLLQGNIELFFFSFTGDYLSAFSINIDHKSLNIATLLAGFLTLLLSTLGYFYLYVLHRKRSSYFYENCRGSFPSALYFTLVNGVLNVFRGMIHRSAINEPTSQATLLFLLECSEVFFMILCWKRLQIFLSKYVALLFLSGSFTRAIFNVSLLASSAISIDALDYLHIVIFLINVLTFLLAVLQSIYEFCTKLKRIYSGKVRSIGTASVSGINKSNIFDRRSIRDDSSQSKEQESSVEQRQVMEQKTITFKICRKQVATAFTIKPREDGQRSEKKQQLESINLQ